MYTKKNKSFSKTVIILLCSLLNFIGQAQEIQSTHKTFSKTIYFHYISTELNSKSIKSLEELSHYLIQNPQLKVLLRGYSCNIVDKDKAWEISKKRAKCVKKYFIKKGIKVSRLDIKYFGSRYYSWDAQHFPREQIRFRARRVEVEITE